MGDIYFKAKKPFQLMLEGPNSSIWGQMALELMHIIAEKSEIWRICLDDLDRHHNPAPTLIGLNYEEFERQWEMRKN